jgi:hypothetical protein
MFLCYWVFRRANMAHKICAITNGILTLALVYRLILRGTQNEFDFFGILIICSAGVAIGCWQRRRWLVALGAIPIVLYAFGFAILSSNYNTTYRTDELSFVVFFAILAVILEITSFVLAGKPPKQPGDEDDSENRMDTIFPNR